MDEIPPALPKSYNLIEELEDHFSPSNFLIPGWSGDSLISKQALLLKKAQKEFVRDALVKFNQFDQLNRSLKRIILDDFIHYTEHNGIQNLEIQDFSQFWAHYQDEKSPYKSLLEEFARIFCHRAVIIYLYKVKFIIALDKCTWHESTSKGLMNPNSFLARVFPMGSSMELICESLQTNQYSWYRPSASLVNKVTQLKECFSTLSITELMKVATFSDLDKGNHLIFKDESYSHSMSHKAYGLFINSLLVFFPIWLKQDTLTYPQKFDGVLPEILNTKFVGDGLNSISHSHWLAQESNLHLKWSEILCPDFSGDSYDCGLYAKIGHELQFLTFLTQLAKQQGHDPIHLITTTIREKYSKSKDDMCGQSGFLSKLDVRPDLVYERIVLNLLDFPKTNPHHHLIQQIQNQGKNLSQNGHLYVFSSQKLFVPSQKSKVEQLLRDYKIDAFFNLDDLKFRGEIPNHLYILSKRNVPYTKKMSKGLNFGQDYNGMQKESCLTFRLVGELGQFNQFQTFVDEMVSFFTHKGHSSTSMYQKELGENLHFEFHQDAILDGILMSSANKNSDHVTHPSFFRNLTKSCSPLDQFFAIESLESEYTERSSITSDLLGITINKEDLYPFVLIVDYRNPAHINLEIVASESYKAKVDQYGMAYFQYFGLLPKKQSLNINLFREFFQTSVGHQIIQLNLHGGYKKLKSKLKSLLIPNFFNATIEAPLRVQEAIEFLTKDKETLLKIHPDNVAQSYRAALEVTEDANRRYPWFMASVLTHFKTTLRQIKDTYDQFGIKSEEQFKNPLIISELVKLPSFPLYPNPDIYVDFCVSNKSLLSRPLETITLDEDGEGNSSLSLISDDVVISKIFSDKKMLHFIKFIMLSAAGTPISQIIHALKVPKVEDFNHILTHQNSIKDMVEGLYHSADQKITQLFTQQISN